MADEGSYWGDKHRPFVKIGTDPQELAELADAIVRGASICHAEIADLRMLIEAVQAHPQARLATIEADGKSRINDPTILTIRGGAIALCPCENANVQVVLQIASHFRTGARFDKSVFTASIGFDETHFSGRTSFANAVFVADVVFAWTIFEKPTSFRGAHFRRSGDFIDAFFADVAMFQRSRFEKNAIFFSATFASGARFDDADLMCMVTFARTVFGKRTSFVDARLSPLSSFQKAVLSRDFTIDARLVDMRQTTLSESRLASSIDSRARSLAFPSVQTS